MKNNRQALADCPASINIVTIYGYIHDIYDAIVTHVNTLWIKTRYF